jgi:uncharacterized protein YecA (UPF0149 family)
MNTHTGEIVELEKTEFSKNEFLPVAECEMTKKQKKTKMVSLKDHKSILGKRLTNHRKKQKVGRNELCPCGSGIKYKKCCLRFIQ